MDQSHFVNRTAAVIPVNCATRNAGSPAGAIPAKVSERDRAMVAPGFANDVGAVNR